MIKIQKHNVEGLSWWTQRCIAVIVGLVVLSGNVADAQAAGRHNKVIVCYVSTWAVYRPTRGSFTIEDLDPSLCTHIVYAFAGLDVEQSGIKTLDAWQDLKDDYGKGGFERVVNLKQQYPHLKVTLAIGGWNEGSKNYSQMAASPERRSRFVKHASEFVRKYRFDGLDLDWEYPTQRGGEAIDRDNFVSLVKELKADFKQHNLLLTSAIGAAKHVIDSAYNVRTLSRYLDYFHIMCYDYGGAWDRKVTANAPLTSDDSLNVEFTIDYLISQGASPSKLVLGVPFYGRTFVTQTEIGRMGDAASDVGFQGPYTKENGFIGYNELCTLLTDKTSGWTSTYDTVSGQGIARYRDAVANETRVVTYDSMRSIAVKIRYAVRKGLAGAMVWSVDTDDFRGDCAVEQGSYVDFPSVDKHRRTFTNFPLLRTLNEAIVITLDDIKQEEEDAENEIPHGDDETNEPNHNKPSTAGPSLTGWSLLNLTISLVVFTIPSVHSNV